MKLGDFSLESVGNIVLLCIDLTIWSYASRHVERKCSEKEGKKGNVMFTVATAPPGGQRRA